MNKLIKTILLASTFIICTSSTQITKIEWYTFTDIEYDYEFSAEHKSWYNKPIFNNLISRYNGKVVEVQGYVIPATTDPNSRDYYVSYNPNAACYFCNKAGKETVVKLNLKSDVKLNIDDFKTFKGTLELNDQPYQIPYTLNNAVAVDK